MKEQKAEKEYEGQDLILHTLSLIRHAASCLIFFIFTIVISVSVSVSVSILIFIVLIFSLQGILPDTGCRGIKMLRLPHRVVAVLPGMGYGESRKEVVMDQKKTGALLKKLRLEKGLTQEQLAEVFGVSDRTVSRWENGRNLPDLSLLVELADYYDSDIREIIDGERRSDRMDKEMKDTLQKVADYGDTQKEKAERAGSMAFGVSFLICAAVTAGQILWKGNLSLVMGETVILLGGGIVYLIMTVRAGAFERKIRGTGQNYTLISGACAGIFSVLLFFFYLLHGAAPGKAAAFSLLFFALVFGAGYGLLFLLSRESRSRGRKEEERKESGL